MPAPARCGRLAPLARVAALAVATFLALPLCAETLVVVEAKGVSLQAGQSVDGAAKLVLKEGERVTLISSDGRTIKLRGPYDDAPAPGGGAGTGGGDVVKSLKSLVDARKAGTGTLGVVRAGAQGPDLPDPWDIDPGRPGARCLVTGQPVVLWRPTASQTGLNLAISPADRSWKATGIWPGGTERLTLPDALPIRDGRNYLFELGAEMQSGQTQAGHTLTFHIMPAPLTNPAAQAAWMLEKGCDGQAAALLKSAE